MSATLPPSAETPVPALLRLPSTPPVYSRSARHLPFVVPKLSTISSEAAQHILRFLDPDTVCLTVSRISRRYHVEADNTLYWREIAMRMSIVVAPTWNGKTIKQVVICWAWRITTQFREVFPTYPIEGRLFNRRMQALVAIYTQTVSATPASLLRAVHADAEFIVLALLRNTAATVQPRHKKDHKGDGEVFPPGMLLPTQTEPKLPVEPKVIGARAFSAALSDACRLGHTNTLVALLMASHLLHPETYNLAINSAVRANQHRAAAILIATQKIPLSSQVRGFITALDRGFSEVASSILHHSQEAIELLSGVLKTRPSLGNEQGMHLQKIYALKSDTISKLFLEAVRTGAQSVVAFLIDTRAADTRILLGALHAARQFGPPAMVTYLENRPEMQPHAHVNMDAMAHPPSPRPPTPPKKDCCTLI